LILTEIFKLNVFRGQLVHEECQARKVSLEDTAKTAKWAWLDQRALLVHLD